MERFRIFFQLLNYLWSNKKYWMMPLILVLVLLGIVMVVSESSVVGSFIYTLF